MSPELSAFIGSILTTWMTFAPCFLFIFTFAPYIEYIRGQKIFTDALSAITASVVGVIFNLSLWFVFKLFICTDSKSEWGALNFSYPVLSSVDWYSVVICAVALIMQFKFKAGLFKILGVSVSLGIAVKMLLV